MKLLYCPECGDIFNLRLKRKSCTCGKVWGLYLEDGNQAEYHGGIPLGFKNSSFANALHSRSERGPGTRFEAFTMPIEITSMREVE